MDVTKEEIKNQIIKAWVTEYSDLMYSWALNKTSSKEIAEDLVQDTFFAALKSFDNFQNICLPKTWLFTILNNKIIDYYRKKSNKHNSLDQLSENGGDKFANSLFDKNGKWELRESNTIWHSKNHIFEDEMFQEKMRFCISGLPEKWKMVIDSKYMLEKDSAVICQELDMSKSNYWQILHRAKLLLKTCIEKYWGNENHE